MQTNAKTLEDTTFALHLCVMPFRSGAMPGWPGRHVLRTRGHVVCGMDGAGHAERPAAAAGRLILDHAVRGRAPPVHRRRQAMRMRKRLVRHLHAAPQLSLMLMRRLRVCTASPPPPTGSARATAARTAPEGSATAHTCISGRTFSSAWTRARAVWYSDCQLSCGCLPTASSKQAGGCVRANHRV